MDAVCYYGKIMKENKKTVGGQGENRPRRKERERKNEK